MKVRLAFWSFAALTIFFFVRIVKTESLKPKVVTKALNASVLLHMKTPLKSGEVMYSECSGTYIDKFHILTAAHCFEEKEGFPKYVWARGPNESVGYPVKLVRFSRAKDLALLEVPYNHSYIRLANRSKRGETIFNIGSPYSFEFVVSEGMIGAKNFHMFLSTSHYLVTTAMINPGSSGGGAFNKYGELVGVNTAAVGLFGWSGISLAVDVEDVKEFLAGDLL
jgi:S1-C subfamily serine protease